ncbi:TfoX/Sxy family protein [Paludisphaera rhizosphaerae]|uniref:TfoX/Sxy family protein n=1 Tax=Paludisphaera rhizosphaerae TaxID=2711216 RepID=UPI0013EC7033|nr:TfoX/Sxy family protein [Paludisphaera rhizosphaerae]
MTKRKKPPNRPDWLEAVLTALDPLGEITSRAMFGGYAIYQRGRIFALAGNGRLYLKADEQTEGDFRARGMGPFQPWEGLTLKSYFEVPPDVLGDPEALRAWAAESILASLRLG